MDTPGYSALRKGRFSVPGGIYHVVTTSHCRRPLFQEFWSARAVVATLHGSTGVVTLAYALMPDHLHWLLRLGERPLADELEALKSVSARRINRRLGRRGAVWAPGYFERALRREEDLRDAARYVVANPLRAGLVETLSDYSHWDAVWLNGSSSALMP